MKIVLDTNVLVSGLINPKGVPGENYKSNIKSGENIIEEIKNIVCHWPIYVDKVKVSPELKKIYYKNLSSSGILKTILH